MNEEHISEAANTAPESLPEAEHTQDFNGTDALTKAQAEARINMEGWQRTLAEFQNYKRRVEREQKDLRQRASVEALTKILPIMDDFERALASIPTELAENPWMNGVSLILGKFKRLLEDHHVEILDPVGQPFDPNRHQAITIDQSDTVESGHVIETLQKGYISGEILLRPALVRVAS
ncbi:MAG: hypothetical protein OHK0046_30120 [Anaerolineae bacterium]